MTHTPHSREAALKSAGKRRFGDRWIVFTWDASAGEWCSHGPADYLTARRLVETHRRAVLRDDIEGR